MAKPSLRGAIATKQSRTTSKLRNSLWIASPFAMLGVAMTKTKRESGTPRDACFNDPRPSRDAAALQGLPAAQALRGNPGGSARLSAFHRGSRQGDVGPQGSASGHVSRDQSGTSGPVRPPQPGSGDLALLHGRYPRRKEKNLSQSSEAPRAPVIVPADMMPKPPGNDADEASPAGTALAPPPSVTGRRPSRRASFDSQYVT